MKTSLPFSLSPTAHLSQDNGSINGTITDEWYAYRNDDSDNKFKTTVSDANGKFVFDKVPAGNYKVALSFVGFEEGILNGSRR
jgi:hypothetical protein